MKTQLVLFCAVSLALFYCKSSNKEDKEIPSAAQTQSSPDTSAAIEMEYLTRGKGIVTEAQAVLAKNLMGAISQGGAEYALEFCNSKAIRLTDSMAIVFNSAIKRVSDKPRNPSNLANDSEVSFIQSLQEQLKRGEVPSGKVHSVNGKILGLYPIVTNAMCLQCHGKKDIDIKPATHRKINKLYPDDKATGYGVNELRGLWVVEMNKK